jgi:alginate O-acetyltransferase complex protein AlgI
MNVASLVFALFCTIALLVYWRLPDRLRVGWLLLVSLAFIITWSWELAGILLVVATTNYFLGRWLGSAQNEKKGLLWIGIAFNIFILLALKYSNFYIGSLISLLARLGIGVGAGGLQLLVPIGLSFIALQMISYQVDIYRGQFQAERRWLEFCTCVLYFPKFLSGPIERAGSFLRKLDARTSPDNDQLVRAFGLIFIGLVRKRLIADVLNALIPADAFVHPLSYSASLLLTWLLAYAFALYNDFAGYSSIVRGISSLFGIELPNNFNVPYLSRSFSEFWSRWHITLSNWLRDYIYFPLSRALLKRIPARENIINILLPPIVTMLVSGLWHGVAWNLLLWGGIHGTFLFVERVLKLRGPNIPPGELPKFRQVIGTLIVFVGVVLAWLPFRMDFITAKRYLAGLILPARWVAPNWTMVSAFLQGRATTIDLGGWDLPDPRILLVLVPAFLLDWFQNHYRDELYFQKWHRLIQVALLVVALLGIIMLAFSDTSVPFVYQGF